MTIPRLAPGSGSRDARSGGRVEPNCRALLRQGFIYVRTVVLPHNPSGALFQRPAQRGSTPRPQEQRLLATADRLWKQDGEASCDQPLFTDEGIQAGLWEIDLSDQAMRNFLQPVAGPPRSMGRVQPSLQEVM